jgi:iron complex outermembrane receptor protein
MAIGLLFADGNEVGISVAERLVHHRRWSTQKVMSSIAKAVVAVLSAIASVAAGAVHAADGLAGPDTAEGSPDKLETLIVLGTGHHDTTELTSTAPVDVITPEQLKETGAVTVNEALSKLHPSFNFPQGQNAVKGQGVRAASLRGVGPAYTLILVNGKRRNPSALLANTDPWPAAQVVDINSIPFSAIDHIEVLRDGAAAQYGSDAIAGVINIVLKNTAHGGDVTAQVGGYSDGGGQTQQYLGTKGWQIGDKGFINLNVQRLYNGNVDRSEADWRQLFPNGDPRNQSYPAKYGQWGQAKRDNWGALLNTEVPFADSWTAYGWASWADENTSDYVNPERVVKANTQSATATTPDKVSETAVLSVYPNGYQPWMRYHSRDYSAVGGVRFSDEVLGDLDTAVSYGRNEVGRYTYNTINPSWGPASPTSFYLGSWKSHTTSVTSDYRLTLDIPVLQDTVLSAGVLYRNEEWGTGDLGDYIGNTAGPLAGKTLASLYGPGGIYNQFASQFPGVNFATDTSVVPATGSSTAGIQPIDAGSVTRSVYGGYAGLDTKVFEKLDVGITGRYEHYSDFGSTSNYRFTTRYEFIPAVAVRGTVSSGFHAPSLAELGQQATGYTSTFSNNGISILAPGHTLQFRPDDPRAALFGGKPLQPEKSTTESFGVVLRPDRTSSVTVDAYQLAIRNVITNTDAIQGPNATAAFNSLGLTGYTQATYYLNAWNSRTRGVDVVAKKDFVFTESDFAVTAATSFLKTDISDVNGEVTVNAVAGSNAVIGASRIRDAETGTPRNKVILDGRYSIEKWSFDATGTRYSRYRYNVGTVAGVATANGNIDQVFSPETYLDLSIDYQALKQLRVELLVQNALNKYPDKYVLGNRSSGINPYSFIAPNGASGRFILAGLTYTLE